MGSEEASDYLARTNFKSLIEWMTAECILNRPDDPVNYCRNLLDVKISERGGGEFAATQPTEYVRGCYAEASAMADEHGRIHGKTLAPVTSSINTQMSDLQERLTLLEKIVVASRAVSQHLDPSEACNTIVSESCSILDADRASIFQLTSDRKSLKLHVAEGISNITVPVGVGIAGTVAQTGVVCNITDAYNDSRFDPSEDRKSGYKTNNILCGPIRDADNQVLGVIQIINKSAGPFGHPDEEVMSMLSMQAGIALRNADLWASSQQMQRKVTGMIDIVKAMYGDMGINSLIFTLTNRVPAVVDADRCTVYIVDGDELWAMQGEANFKIPLDSPGLAPACATSKEVINIPDAYADDRFNTDMDKKTGYETKTILCLPITHKGGVVGVLQIMNKKIGVFNSEDEELLKTFLEIIGSVISTTKLSTKKASEGESTEGFNDGVQVHKASAGAASMETFGEEEEEED